LRTFYYHLATALLLLAPLRAAAQVTTPLEVSVQLLPPYSTCLPDLAAPGSDRLRIQVTQHDRLNASYDFYLVLEQSPALTADSYDRCRPGLSHLAFHVAGRPLPDELTSAAQQHGWRLMFRGGHGSAVATMERHKSGKAPVLVWDIKLADEAALDRYEGYPYLYRKETVTVTLGGKPAETMVYIMNEDGRCGYRPLNQPDAYYYAVILEGYGNAGFNTEYLRRATARSFELEDADYGR
jgi:hypothetical protein